ncbi:hypothetical protein GH714_012950 [Hevea brasiliensis]|uniref:Uncharacterized protein n=1 Tax=Hevea brasiliensis TaxID=3981 RepID=A0A6A6NCH6_HEVBR|nr:hypothetical protein GH714_012950 [Hevea brasiliensis]
MNVVIRAVLNSGILYLNGDLLLLVGQMLWKRVMAGCFEVFLNLKNQESNEVSTPISAIIGKASCRVTKMLILLPIIPAHLQVSYLRPKKVLSMGLEDANPATHGPGRVPSLVTSDFIQNVPVGFKNKRGIGIHLEKLM